MKKIIGVFLIFTLVLYSGNLFAKERKGAELIIRKIGGEQVRGELIAIKNVLLVLLDYYSGLDTTIDIEDVASIRIAKKSKLLEGAGLGLLVGGGIGAGLGYTDGDGEPIGHSWTPWITAVQKALVLGILCGAIGATIGGLSGAAVGKDKTTQITGKSDKEIRVILRKLRNNARIRNHH